MDSHRVGSTTTISIMPGQTRITIHRDYPTTDEMDEESESDQEMEESGEEEESSDEDSSPTSPQQENIPPQPLQTNLSKPVPGYALPHNQLMQQLSGANISKQPLLQTYPQFPMNAPIPSLASAEFQEQVRKQMLYQQERIRQLHEQQSRQLSKEKIPLHPSQGPNFHMPQLKRPASPGNLQLPERNKRHSSGGKKSLEDKIFGDKALNVESFDTFTSQEHLEKEHEETSMDVKVPKAEFERLIQSIPLEDRAKGDCDINETVMVLIR